MTEGKSLEELVKEVNFIVGAVDGDTLKHVRRLISLLRLYQWSYNNLCEAIRSNDLEYINRRYNEISSQLSDELSKL